MKTVLTLDPSFRAFGWAVLGIKNSLSVRILSTGCIKTEPSDKKKRIRKSDDLSRRISEIVLELQDVLEEHKPSLILAEAPHGSQTSAAATMIGAVTGIIQTLATSRATPIEWYSEQDAKKTLLGKRSATKKETVDAVSRLYNSYTPTGVQYIDEATADAIAVFHVAWRTQSPTLRILASL